MNKNAIFAVAGMLLITFGVAQYYSNQSVNILNGLTLIANSIIGILLILISIVSKNIKIEVDKE